jgi:uncharacterized cupredoxin-like copper-binding protein
MTQAIRRCRFLTGAALPLIIAGLLTGCARSGGQEVRIEMTNFKLTPNLVTVSPGEQVRFVLVNRSDVDHEFESDEGKLEEVVVPPGKERTVTWTAPAKAGDYTFECDMAGHDGMVMTVRVADEGAAR